MNLLIVGSVAYDSIKTPFAEGEDILGGSATHSAIAASFFCRPEIVAVVGEDFAAKDEAILQTKNIGLAGLQKTAGKTFRWGGEYGFDLNSRTTLFTELNVFESFEPRLTENQASAKFLFLGNIHPQLQLSVLTQLKQPAFVALDTMNYWIVTAKPELRAVLSKVDALIINESEARELSGEHNIAKCAKVLLGLLKPEGLVVIKRGEYGVLMFKTQHFFYLPAFPLEDVVDPTGAGDSFAGGFMGYLAGNEKPSWQESKNACVAGSAMASFCVEALGTQKTSSVTPEEVHERMGMFENLTKLSI